MDRYHLFCIVISGQRRIQEVAELIVFDIQSHVTSQYADDHYVCVASLRNYAHAPLPPLMELRSSPLQKYMWWPWLPSSSQALQCPLFGNVIMSSLRRVGKIFTYELRNRLVTEKATKLLFLKQITTTQSLSSFVYRSSTVDAVYYKQADTVTVFEYM